MTKKLKDLRFNITEDTYYVRQVELMADEGKLLTKDGVHVKKSILVPENDVQEWYEVLAETE